MKKDDRIYLDHILESFAKVVQYLEDVWETATKDIPNLLPEIEKPLKQ